MKIKNFFLLSWCKAFIVIMVGFGSILLHNLISALLGVEEAFFFIIVVFLVPIYVVISVIWSLISRARKND